MYESRPPGTEFAQLEEMLAKPGPWIAGIDFPFGLPRRFVDDVEWPLAWEEYVRHAESLGKERFEAVLEDYKRARPDGQKEPRRRTDERAGALSPLKLYGQPVAKMFFQGAPRLVGSGVAVPGLLEGDCNRAVVEAYPGVLVRSDAKVAYKRDSPKEQTAEHHDAPMPHPERADLRRIEDAIRHYRGCRRCKMCRSCRRSKG